MSNQKKQIIIEFCDECPFEGECKAWNKLTRPQRVKITIGVGVGRFILKDCHLDNKD